MEKVIDLNKTSLYEFISNLEVDEIDELIKQSDNKTEKVFYYRLKEFVLQLQNEKFMAEGHL